MDTQDKFSAAVKAGLCNFLSVTGGTAGSYAAWGLFTPGPFDEWGALAYSGLAGLAYAYGCQWDPNGPGLPTQDPFTGCQKFSSGYGRWYASGQLVWESDPPVAEVTKFEFYNYGGPRPDLEYSYDIAWLSPGGALTTKFYTPSSFTQFEVRPVDGAVCGDPFPPAPPPTVPPYTWTDPDDGCQINVSFEGFMAEPDGSTGVGWKLEPAPQTRSSGGIIGGCNFNPIIIYQPPGGGGGGGGCGDGPYIPYNPGPPGPGGEPWWADLLRGALGGVVGAGVKALIDELLMKQVGEKVYRIVSVCEKDADGEPVSLSREVEIPEMSWDEAIIYRLDALEFIMQGLKDFKQPICSRSNPVGDWVTVHFESDAPSIAGERPLRKLLRYRDQMASDLAAHAAHWENFVWEAGPVCVIHKNSSWGTPQVWAADAEEGKRVIRHAAIISGVNPDTEGEWLITSSRDPRYGMTGSMRLATRKSAQGMVLRISKRGEPDGLPIVPVDPFP